jgi:hypothetical protein
MKFEREDLIKKNKMLKSEVNLLETQVRDLRHEVEADRLEPSVENNPQPTSPQFSEDSLPGMERVRLKPFKVQRPRKWSFHN